MKTRWHSKSFFIRFLVSYVMILIIPFLTLLLTYFITQQSIRNEILNSNANSLHQFFNVVDSKLAEMTSCAYQVLQDFSIKSIAYSPQNTFNGYKIYEARKYLSGLPRDDFADVFVYYHETDHIISCAYSSLPSDFFYNTYYNGSYATFYQNLTQSHTNMPLLISMDDQRDAPQLAVLLAQNATFAPGDADITAGVVFSPTRLQQILDSATFHQEGLLFIFDQNGNPLVSSSPNTVGVDIHAYNGTDSCYTDTFDGQTYVIQLFHSAVLDCTYVSAIPTAVFWERLNTLRLLVIISLCLCVAASVALAILFAHRNYSPLTSILSTIHSKTNLAYSPSQKNEMDFIREVLIQSFAHIQSESQTLQEDFLYRALQGIWNVDAGEADMFCRNHIYPLSDAFLVVLIRVETVDEAVVGPLSTAEGNQTLSFVLANVFQELCAMEHQGFLLNIAPLSYAGILNFTPGLSPDQMRDAALAVCNRLTSFLEPHFGIISTIAVSDALTGLSGIHAAYLQASQAISYRFIFGKGSHILYRDVVARSFYYNGDATSQAAQILMQYVQDSSKASPVDAIQQVMRLSSIRDNASLESIRCFKYDIVNVVNKIIYGIGASPLERELHWVQLLLDAETLDDFQELLAQSLQQLHLYWNQTREQKTVCDEAAEYVREHYQDPNLSLTSISSVFHITPSYLSKLFKAQKGIGLLEYLSKVRLDLAKELLRNTSLSLEEIAGRTGFLSDITLIKTFKKWEGVTPGAYRKLQGLG